MSLVWLLLCIFIYVLSYLKFFNYIGRKLTSKLGYSTRTNPFLFCIKINSSNINFNKFIKSKYIQIWFAIGSIVVVVFAALLFILFTFFGFHYFKTFVVKPHGVTQSNNQIEVQFSSQLIQFPQLLLFLLALGISVVFHEFGHFSAAISHKIPVRGVGCGFQGVFPCAFVDLCRESLDMAGVTKKMTVYCAGIWHNLILAFVAYFCLLLTAFLWPLWMKNGLGVTVVFSKQQFSGIDVGDVLTTINDCSFSGKQDLRGCLERPWPLYQGFCLPKEFGDILNYDSCQCSADSKKLCFSVIFENSVKKFGCFSASNVRGYRFCQKNENCHGNSLCFAVETDFRRGYLFEVGRRARNSSFYMGNPFDVFQTVALIDFVGDGWRLCYFVDFFLECIFVTSLALATLNILPFSFFDGLSVYKLFPSFLRYIRHFK